MLDLTPASRIGVRDRALLLIGFLGAFRRSELVRIGVSDVEVTTDGLIVALGQTKTDPEGQGRKVGIPRGEAWKGTCPVEALQAWLAESGIEDGMVFRPVDRHGNVGAQGLSGQAVALIVKRLRQCGRARRAPVCRTQPACRAGNVGSHCRQERAGDYGPDRHTSVTTLRRYIRDGELFRDNAVRGLVGGLSASEGR